MQMNGTQAADFIKILHATLQKSANFSDVKISCCEATGWQTQATLTKGLNDAGAGDLVGIISGHEYTSRITFQQPTKQKVWQTEYSDLAGKWSTGWDVGSRGDGLLWANSIYAGLTTGNVSAYLWWVATQDQITNGDRNEKLIRVDNTTNTYQVSKRLWAFAQYSRTVRPGAVRVDISNGGNAGLNTTAFVNLDGSVAVNVINGGTAVADLQIAGLQAASVKAWLTNEKSDFDEIPVTLGSALGASVPARSMISLVVWQKS
jgi:O-glycosyl hydrolase